MLTIYKYPVPIKDAFVIMMPEGAKVLYFATQDDQPTIWARVDSDKPLTEKQFYLRGTGHPVPDEYNYPYLGSCFHMGRFVWHLFEEKEQQ